KTYSPWEWLFRKSGIRPREVPAASVTRICCGCHPVRRVALPDSSSARKKAWSRNGLSGRPPLPGSRAFQVAAGISAVAAKVRAVKPCSGTVGIEPFKNDLVCTGAGDSRLFGRADGPGGYRYAQGPEQPHRRQAEIAEAAGNEVEAGSRPVQEVAQAGAVAIVQLLLRGLIVVSLGDDAEGAGVAAIPDGHQHIRVEGFNSHRPLIGGQRGSRAGRQLPRGAPVALALQLDLQQGA